MPVWMDYVHAVLEGRQIACHWVKAACERHLRDLAHGSERGLRFSESVAQASIDFFRFIKHSKGEWAGRTIELEPWQQFIIAMLFGWKRQDGTRRFRTSYIEVARKNGKSTVGAGIGLHLFMNDGEGGAEVYTAATKRDQARITHSEATRMVKSSPSLRSRITVMRDSLSIADTACKFEPLGADSDTMDGLNVHGAIIDEVHAHKTRDVWDKLETGTGARRQPLLFAITTAGFNRQSLCFQLHEYAQKILDDIIQDDSFFGIVYTLDKDDDWENEANWIKANPNLGISKKVSDMREKAAKAKAMPAALNAFLRLELNIWTQSETKWISVEHWNACGKAVDAGGLKGRTCYAGLDLSSTTDITAFVLIFPPQSPKDDYQVLCRFFIPEDSMTERSKRDRVPYDAWVRQGYITATSGNVIDQDFVLSQIDEDANVYDLKEIAFDRWGSTAIVNKLQEKSLTCVQFGQGFSSMSAPMKELERMVLAHELAHGNNPVLTWMANNLVSAEDAAGNIKPDKEHSIERIDGMVALIMAIARAMVRTNKESVYEKRGVRRI